MVIIKEVISSLILVCKIWYWIFGYFQNDKDFAFQTLSVLLTKLTKSNTHPDSLFEKRRHSQIHLLNLPSSEKSPFQCSLLVIQPTLILVDSSWKIYSSLYPRKTFCKIKVFLIVHPCFAIKNTVKAWSSEATGEHFQSHYYHGGSESEK